MGHDSSKWDGPLTLIGVVDGTRQLQVGLAPSTNWSGRHDSSKWDWPLALIGVVDGTRQL